MSYEMTLERIKAAKQSEAIGIVFEQLKHSFDKLTEVYDFTCEAGKLEDCVEYIKIKQLLNIGDN